MEETDVEFDLSKDVEGCIRGVGVIGDGGNVDLVMRDVVVGGGYLNSIEKCRKTPKRVRF